MRAVSVIAGATAAVVTASVGVAAQAHASNYGIELNGQYLVTSNGDWAKDNEVFHDEKTVSRSGRRRRRALIQGSAPGR